jgi:HTH-type transcriptional regulator/antitoxin HigA
METLEFKVIKNKAQYKRYCNIHEQLAFGPPSNAVEDKLDLLTLLIETWDKEHNTFKDLDPVELLQGLMQEHKMKAAVLADILSVSPGLVSDILSYKKGFSKEIIRKLADHFKVAQEVFNREYDLKPSSPALLQKQRRVLAKRLGKGIKKPGRKAVSAH